MRKHRIIPVMLVSVMTAGLTAYGDTARAETAGSNAGAASTAEETISTAGKETSATPSYEELSSFDITDWTFDDIAGNIIIDGHDIAVPCSINDLPDCFTLVDADTEHDLPYRLKYGGDIIASLPVKDDRILGIEFYGNAMMDHNIYAGKITYDSTADDIISWYGESNYKDRETPAEHGMTGYAFPDGRIAVFINSTYFVEGEAGSTSFEGTIVYIECENSPH